MIFGYLQYRIMAIEKATDRRKVALQDLRRQRSQQLASGVGAVDEGHEARMVQDAIQEYRDAVQQVEGLRTIPFTSGRVRIAPPRNLDRQRQLEEHTMATQQYLGINDTDIIKDDVEQKPPKMTATGETVTLEPWMTAVLLVTALAQVSLLWLFSVDVNTLERIGALSY